MWLTISRTALSFDFEAPTFEEVVMGFLKVSSPYSFSVLVKKARIMYPMDSFTNRETTLEIILLQSMEMIVFSKCRIDRAETTMNRNVSSPKSTAHLDIKVRRL